MLIFWLQRVQCYQITQMLACSFMQMCLSGETASSHEPTGFWGRTPALIVRSPQVRCHKIGGFSFWRKPAQESVAEFSEGTWPSSVLKSLHPVGLSPSYSVGLCPRLVRNHRAGALCRWAVQFIDLARQPLSKVYACSVNQLRVSSSQACCGFLSSPLPWQGCEPPGFKSCSGLWR